MRRSPPRGPPPLSPLPPPHPPPQERGLRTGGWSYAAGPRMWIKEDWGNQLPLLCASGYSGIAGTPASKARGPIGSWAYISKLEFAGSHVVFRFLGCEFHPLNPRVVYHPEERCLEDCLI